MGAVTGVFATTVMVAAPRLAYSAYGHPDGSIGGNTGFVVLGLARGTDWAEASTFIRQLYPSLNERQRNDLMYEMAVETVLHDPWPLVKSLRSGLWNATWSLPQEVAGGFGWGAELPGLARLLFYVLLFGTVIGCAFTAGWIPIAMMTVSLAAFLGMAPVVYNDGGWRIAASLYPGLALVAVTPFLLIRRCWLTRGRARHGKPAPVQPTGPTARGAIWPGQAVIVLALLSLPYPMLTRAFASSNPPPTIDPSILVRFDDSEINPQWTSLNEGRASINVLQDWMRKFGFEEWEIFLRAHGASVRELRNDRGDLVLIVTDIEAVYGQPDSLKMHRWAPRFEIRCADNDCERKDGLPLLNR
jgi:hypothetical protein